MILPLDAGKRRQGDDDFGALARRRADLEPAAVLVDDAAADAEARARSRAPWW